MHETAIDLGHEYNDLTERQRTWRIELWSPQDMFGGKPPKVWRA